MPFEALGALPRKIAVIGGGISGMGAAYMLSAAHQVTLIETEPRLGGHARTIMAGQNGNLPVDTGFLVFNYANYPYLAALFHDLAVPVAKSNMSFGASIGGGRLEYALTSMDAVFAQRRNLANPRFLRMLRDIVHFNKNAVRVANEDRTLTIGSFLDRLGVGTWFRDYYLLPLSGAIWSTPTEKIMDFPAHAMMQFFENHALLNYSGQHQWYTVKGGSREYVSRLRTAMEERGVDIRLGSPVQAIERGAGFARIKMPGHGWETFDEVVLATHSDVSLKLLTDAAPRERAALGAVKYQPNEVVLHADASIMPKSKKVWASWVYTEDVDAPSDRIDLTYWINSLQPLPANDPHFVTLNTKRTIREELIYDQTVLRHPVYDLGVLKAQEDIRAFNGTNSTWFCGAWMRHGFHEDGLASAVEVAERVMLQTAAQLAAE